MDLPRKHSTLRAGSIAAKLAALLLLAGCTVNIQSNLYDQIAEVPAKADLAHEKYLFSVTPPHKTLEETTWRVFFDKKDNRSTLLHAGLPGHSYTLSILYKNSMAEIERLSRIAAAHHQNLHFDASPYNPNCMSSNLLRMTNHTGPVRSLMAICLNPQTLEVYEIVFTQRSRLAEESDLPTFAEAMNTVMRSFKFK